MSHLLALYMGSLILRSIGIAVIAGICSWKIRNVAIRHAVWVVVLGSILLMPAADYLLPATWVPARIQQLAAEQPVTFHIVSARAGGAPLPHSPAEAALALPARSKPVDLWNVAVAIYVLVAFAMFIRLALGYRKIRRLRRTGRTIASPVWEEVLALHRSRWRIPVLLESEEVQVPLTIGLLCPAVILPADWKDWDDWKMRAVLLHEIAHIRRKDWGIAVIAAAAKCAYWLNPLSWFLERKLSKLAEQASDDASLCRTQNETRYAEILLEFAAATQNGGRLVKGGVAMAQHKIQERIERVLGKPQPGTGIVKIAGWALVIILSVPVIYSAAALQVQSEPRKAPLPTYAVERGRNPASQTLPAGTQAAPSPVPATAPQVRQNPSNPSADLLAAFQMELENRKLQREYRELKQKLAEAQLAASLANSDPAPDLQSTAMVGGSVAFLQYVLKKKDEELRTLQAAMQQQIQANPPPPSALLDLPDNEDDLLAYLTALASLRGNPNPGTYTVSFTGIQGRTVSMKVSGQNFSFGCESCSFFVGESVVGSASPAPLVPGMFVRLSSDGRDLNITCHATKCNVMEYEVLGDGTEQVSNPRQLESGASELFRTSKPLLVVISKN